MKICKKCILDENIPNIKFDQDGICNYCHLAEKQEALYPNDNRGKKIVKNKIEKIKKDGKNKRYDCIVGVSGGVDSSYVIYLTQKYGLRTLAVHFDNGWNSPIGVNNIKKIIKKYNIDLYTYVVEWDEFKSLQLAFLKASVPDVELLSDYGKEEILYRTADKYKIKHIIKGNNFRTEGTIPRGWTYMDSKYFKHIVRTFSDIRIKSYPVFSRLKRQYLPGINKPSVFKMLNLINYNKKEVISILEHEMGWQNYGGKHYESVFTRFFQAYYLPVKFGIDKRKVHLSALIRSSQISRSEAIKQLKKKPEDYDLFRSDFEDIYKKFDLSKKEFEEIMKLPPKTFIDYPNNFNKIKIMKKIYLKFKTNVYSRP